MFAYIEKQAKCRGDSKIIVFAIVCIVVLRIKNNPRVPKMVKKLPSVGILAQVFLWNLLCELTFSHRACDQFRDMPHGYDGLQKQPRCILTALPVEVKVILLSFNRCIGRDEERPVGTSFGQRHSDFVTNLYCLTCQNIFSESLQIFQSRYMRSEATCLHR